jgi:putative transposase
VQYASHDYTEMLKQHHATISMSRKGNPYDNAACESLMKTLKQEEIYRNEYGDFHNARSSIGEFLESVCDQKRLHSALGCVPPAEFESGATGDLTQLRQNGSVTGRISPSRPRLRALPHSGR